MGDDRAALPACAAARRPGARLHARGARRRALAGGHPAPQRGAVRRERPALRPGRRLLRLHLPAPGRRLPVPLLRAGGDRGRRSPASTSWRAGSSWRRSAWSCIRGPAATSWAWPPRCCWSRSGATCWTATSCCSRAGGASFGASYADVHATLPALGLVIGLAGLAAVTCLVQMARPGFRLALAGVGLWLAGSLLGLGAYPTLIQRLHVVPNEIIAERPTSSGRSPRPAAPTGWTASRSAPSRPRRS